MKTFVIRHCRAAATSFVIAAAALAAAADPAPIDESVSSEELCRRANDGDMYAFADDFLLEREAKKNGFATAWAFVQEGLDPPTDPDARAFWNGLREDYPNAPSDDARERFLLLDWQTRFAERRNKLLVALREAATIQYAATATRSRAAEESHAEDAEAAESGSPAGGAGERSETEGVSHAENAESAEP